MKKKFNILVALVCVIALGFAGCSTVEDWLAALLARINAARSEEGGENITDSDGFISANADPQVPVAGEYIIYVDSGDESENKSDDLPGYLYVSSGDVYVGKSDDIPSDSNYKWLLEVVDGATYTFRLKHASTNNYISNANSGDNNGRLTTTSNISSAATMQMWLHPDGYNVILRTNNPNSNGYNTYWYYNTTYSPKIWWWGNYNDNLEVTYPLAVTLIEE